MKNWWIFHSYVNVYQRVTGFNGDLIPGYIENIYLQQYINELGVNIFANIYITRIY